MREESFCPPALPYHQVKQFSRAIGAVGQHGKKGLALNLDLEVSSRGILQVPKYALYVFSQTMSSMWAINVKPNKASKKWHKKALMVDLRRTTLVIERRHVNSEHVPPWIHRSQFNPQVPRFFVSATHDADWMGRVQVDNWGGGSRC